MFYFFMQNFFVLFSMQVSCEMDDGILRQRYFDLQKKYHPDYSLNRDIDIALVNKGYEFLSSKLLRLRHILEINDVKFSETIADTEFLMQCMEWQEDKVKNRQEIIKQMDLEVAEAIKYINLKDFKSSCDCLQKVFYLDKLLQ